MGEKKDYLRKYQFRRYQAKPFRNPYFQGQKRSRRPWKHYAVAFLVALGVVGIVYFFGFAPFWNIKDVRIEGLQFMPGTDIATAAEKELYSRRYLIFPERNHLFFDVEHLRQSLNQQFSFEELTVTVVQKVVVIKVKERVSEVLWMAGDQTSFIDVHGTVIRVLPKEDADLLIWHGADQPSLDGQPLFGPWPRIAYLNSLPLIVNLDGKPALPGSTVLGASAITSLITLSQSLSQQGLAVRKYSVEHADSQWADAKLRAGFDVYFDLTADVKAQLGYLATVLQKEGADYTSINYIDVRFGDHVYIKRN